MKSAKDSHIEYCGVSFKCSDCGVQYTSYETLLTHGRRKEHKVLEKKSFKVSQPQSEAIKSASSVSINPIKERRILPKYSTSVQMVPIRAIVTSEKGSQTDVCRDIPKLKSKHTQVCFRRFFLVDFPSLKLKFYEMYSYLSVLLVI